ncbi:MAG: hypothetical protein GY805_34185 [Chloroflexi bacterium]|nr:hypothetical protein [Chloroflexota bacterium]
MATTTTYTEILQAAQHLKSKERKKLAHALLHDKTTVSPPPELTTLTGLSISELQVMAAAILSPARQNFLKALLEKQKEETLTKIEATELDRLLEESDHIALLKAKAAYTLALLQD